MPVHVNWTSQLHLQYTAYAYLRQIPISFQGETKIIYIKGGNRWGNQLQTTSEPSEMGKLNRDQHLPK